MHPGQTLRVMAFAAVGLASVVMADTSVAQTASSESPGSADAAWAPAQHLLTGAFAVSVGAFVVATKFDGGLNGTAHGAGTSQDVNFDQDFGTNADATRVRADLLWRFLPRHRLRFLYFDNHIKRTRALAENVEWGDYTFQQGSGVTAEYRFTVYELAYEYAFLRTPSTELVASAGVHYSDISLGLSGNATVTLPDGTVKAASFHTKTSSLPAPLPVVGLRGGWALSQRWYLDAQAQLFKFKIDAFDGSWWDLKVGATWMYNRHIGIGAGWNKFTTHVDVDKSDFHGRLNTGYSGLLVYLTGVF